MNDDISLTAEMLECNKIIKEARREERERCVAIMKSCLTDAVSLKEAAWAMIRALEDEK